MYIFILLTVPLQKSSSTTGMANFLTANEFSPGISFAEKKATTPGLCRAFDGSMLVITDPAIA